MRILNFKLLMLISLSGTILHAGEFEKSKSKAIWLSFAVPGLGELYLNNWKSMGSGKYFMAGEAMMWAGFFYFRSYGKWVHTDSRAFATRNAGVVSGSKPASYYFNIAKYGSIYEYNDAERRLNAGKNVYAETSENFWQWQNDKVREKYDRMRIDATFYKRVASYVLFSGLMNRVLSAAQTARLFKQMKTQGISMNVQVFPDMNLKPAAYWGITKQF